ncbi:uncharacterized protein LAJ45_07735 [Morchella importuna]|uniref:uncharacterized protein n=1 Tax=Morchella importuna TaxID=1174673 RepID=UPI001E8CD3A0|nr:uncharacterized protein LAJ45_07735 [Morchella importuna]KAH8148282.1 hypothetical protein LAJ45_07735 [Morchella importuna]
MRHLIPTTKEVDSQKVAMLYIDNVWKLHGLPDTVVSDRGTQFVAEFWKSLCKRLEISPRFSTAFHPQTDGQTESINAVMEQYLRSYVSYQQDDWTRLLAMAEFAANNHVSETTRISPFYANSGRNPRMTFGPLEHGKTTAEDQANSIAKEMKDMVEFLKSEMFRIKRIVNPYAYELELPRSMKIHPVFHVSLLSPEAGNPLPDNNYHHHPSEIEGEEEWEVEDILDSRKRNGRFEYLVRYVGYDDASGTVIGP